MKTIEHLNQIKIEENKAIVLDCFGTLMEITNKLKPYSYLFNFLEDNKIIIKDYRSYVMTRRLSLADIEKDYEIVIPDEVKLNFNNYLLNELESIVIYPEVHDFLIKCHDKGVKTIICSNLAEPYGFYAKKLEADDYVLSYDVGYIKPQPEIFKLCHEKLQLDKKDILFIGDHIKHDFNASQEYGFNSILIQRN